MNQNQGITVEEVKYIGVSGESVFIDFRDCNQDWIQYRIRTENLKNEAIIRNDKTIGQRDSDAFPPIVNRI